MALPAHGGNGENGGALSGILKRTVSKSAGFLRGGTGCPAPSGKGKECEMYCAGAFYEGGHSEIPCEGELPEVRRLRQGGRGACSQKFRNLIKSKNLKRRQEWEKYM